jgi:hypothetical protein
MIPGEAYRLEGHRRTKVTVLDTPPELRRQARVRVRFESGIKAGEEGDLPSRRIVAPWEPTQQPRKKPAAGSRRRSPTAKRSPQVGDSVMWTETGTIVWTLEALDQKSGEATIRGLIFAQPKTRTVPVEQLELHVEEQPQGGPSPFVEGILGGDDLDQARHDLESPREPARASLRPEKPRRELEVLLENVLFSNACLDAYRRRYAGRLSGQALLNSLRDEILRSGFIMDGGLPRSGEYARLRVPKRFDVVLRTCPTADEPVTITGLHWARPKRKRQPGSGSKRRAA